MGSATFWSLLSLCWPLWSGVSGSGYGASYVLFVFQGNGSSSSAEEVEPVWECDAYGANFGFQLPADKELLACVQGVQPPYACHGPVEPPAYPPRNASLHCPDFFALADRGNCTFGDKARLVQEAQSKAGSALFTGLIVENSLDKPPTPMSAAHATEINIPLYMIENSCAERLRNTYTFDRGYYVVIRNAGLVSIVRYLIPFIVVLGLAFIVLLIITIVKFVRDRRRRQRRRLSSRNLRKLPTKKYKKAEGEEAETCPICLDDFEDGEKLRVLPCNHAYHCKCVDPWLTKNRKVCPVCKRKVCPSKDDSSDSESEDTSAAPTNSSNVEPQGTGDEEQLLPAANPPPSALRRVLPGFLRRGREPVAHPPPQSPIEEVPSTTPSLSQATDEDDAGAFSDLPQPDVATRQPRRKRHPATVSGRNVPRPGPNRMSLVQSPPDEAETSGADPSRQRAATHVLPPPIPTQAPTHHNHPHRMRPRHRNAAASAPAHLRDPLEDEEDANYQHQHQQQSRDDSIAIDLDQAPPQV